MDPFTHALSGALLGRATAARGEVDDDDTRRLPVGTRIAAGALAAAFPDADVVLGFLSPVSYLTLHRGPTHSLVLAPFFALLLAGCFALLWRRRSLRAFYGIALGGIVIHILGDWITSFGTMMLWPLSDHRFALSTTFIIDLWLSAIIVAALAASAVWRSSRVPAAAGFMALFAYLGMQAWAHGEAIDIGRAKGPPQAAVTALPRPASPFNWMVIVDDGETYRYANVRTVAGTPLLARVSSRIEAFAAPYVAPDRAVWNAIDRFGPAGPSRELVEQAWRTPGLRFFRWFADAPVAVEVKRGNPSTCVWFQDLRFLTPGRDAWPFRYGACRTDATGEWRAYDWNEGTPIPIEGG